MAELHTKTPFSRSIPKRLRTKPNRKNLQKARSKHNPRSSSPPPPPFSTAPPPQQPPDSSPFLTRLFSLPTEIRLQIYRILLVRPCKFDLRHGFACHVGIVGIGYRGTIMDNLWYTSRTFVCAECDTRRWRWQGLAGADALTSTTPARSVWARRKRNPYLCDRCYPEMLYRLCGPEKWPSLAGLACLCARRQNLGVLLVNRRIYEEAWPVFWAENTFAFEDGRVLVDFLEEIGEEKRARLRSIALLAPSEDGLDLEEEELSECWALLKQCAGLRELELDSGLLDRLEFVLEMRTLAVKQVQFTERAKKMGFDSYDQGYRERKMTPWLAYRRTYTDPLAELLTASMTQELADEERLRRAFELRVRLRSLVDS